MIDYFSDIISSIHLFASMISCIIGVFLFICLIYPDNPYNDGIKNNYKLLVKIALISLFLTIFTPTNLKYNIADKYRKENSKLNTQLIQMNTIINKHGLQKELRELQYENY